MNIAELGITSVAAITVICFLICQAFKATPLDNKFLPVIAGVSGGILGYIGMSCIADYPAADPMTAVAVGIVSGLAATGINEVYKQLSTSTK